MATLFAPKLLAAAHAKRLLPSQATPTPSLFMNLLLLRPEDFLAGGHSAHVTNYRAEHIAQVLKLEAGNTLTVGIMNGLTGRARIHSIDASGVVLTDIELNQAPPSQLDLELILALPRPRMLARSLQTVATMGVKTLHLIHTERVEKSFWQSPLLKPAALQEQLILGVEQARATQLPELHIHAKWRPFVQEQLPYFANKRCIIAHPGDYPFAQPLAVGPAVLAIGPEGGFTPEEVTTFVAHAFTPVQLGERILRVETAVPVLLAKLF